MIDEFYWTDEATIKGLEKTLVETEETMKESLHEADDAIFALEKKLVEMEDTINELEDHLFDDHSCKRPSIDDRVHSRREILAGDSE